MSRYLLPIEFWFLESLSLYLVPLDFPYVVSDAISAIALVEVPLLALAEVSDFGGGVGDEGVKIVVEIIGEQNPLQGSITKDALSLVPERALEGPIFRLNIRG